MRIIIAGTRLSLGLAVAMGVAAAFAAEPAAPIVLTAEGSFPLQYIESLSRKPQRTITGAPFLALTAAAQLDTDLNASVFVNGGHNQIGSFRENDNTFASVGGNVVRKWDRLVTGFTFEHTQYFNGTFESTNFIANDANVFARYSLVSNDEIKVTPGASVSMRLDETFSVQRYSFSTGMTIERRLFDKLWAVAAPAIRYSDYVGGSTGRTDIRLAAVGGLKYVVNDNVSARMLAGYETRASNVSRSADRYSIGASLDFNMNLTPPRWPGI